MLCSFPLLVSSRVVPSGFLGFLSSTVSRVYASRLRSVEVRFRRFHPSWSSPGVSLHMLFSFFCVPLRVMCGWVLNVWWFLGFMGFCFWCLARQVYRLPHLFPSEVASVVART
ncbi:hypothetical protein KC19_8G144300 [Ceratodon purpureus]|uniref:Transmembrane protein n=1 Tax=Ceratodon purpureus TaxID=3225 RepID=A0A8T0H2A0_CERPU|nr:hypothetical protein KC19_8G144300 [Ceratodon purpureus]